MACRKLYPIWQCFIYIHRLASDIVVGGSEGNDCFCGSVEAAEAIEVSRSKVYVLLGSGELPSVRVGGSVRVPLDQLQRGSTDSTPNSAA